MKKKIIALTLALTLIISVFAFLAACESKPLSWDISATESDSLTARVAARSNGEYLLSVSGSGEMKDFETKADVPWADYNSKITEIVIGENVKGIGNNAFTAASVDKLIVPLAVETVGENVLPDDAQLFVSSASTEVDKSNANIALFSDKLPSSSSGNFWHYDDDGSAVRWTLKRVLFVGNSFTYYSDVNVIFDQIAKNTNQYVEVEALTSGGWTLQQFASSSDNFGKQLEEKLNARSDYDYIILQEQSTRPYENYTLFLNGACDIKTKIDNTQDNAEIYLYATWGYPTVAQTNGWTVPFMESKLRSAYNDAATTLNVNISHVGTAFSKVYEENSNINLYHSDNKHQSYAGAYLSACVHAETILGIDIRSATFNGELSETHAEILRNAAHSTVITE